MLRHYEVDHLAHQLHAKIVEHLYRNGYTWDELNSKGELPFEDNEVVSELTRLGYNCRFTISIESYKGKNSGPPVNRCKLDIVFTDKRGGKEKTDDKKYDYTIFISGGPIKDNLPTFDEDGDEISEDEDGGQEKEEKTDPKLLRTTPGRQQVKE